MEPLAATHASEKSVSFQKSILGPRLKHITVNNVKVPVASDNVVKQLYKPLSKPGVGFSKPNFRSKTPPPRRVNTNYPRAKIPQPKRNIGRQNQPHGFPICLGVDLVPDEWIKDSGCSKHTTGNRKLFSTYKAYNGGNIIFDSNLRSNIIGKVPGKDYILLPLWPADPLFSQSSKSSPDAEFKPLGDDEKKNNDNVNSTNNVNAASTNKVNFVGRKSSVKLPDDLNMPELEDIFYSDDDEDVGTKADMNNLDAFMPDERGIVIRNKARLVAQGYTQEEGIYYDEAFSPIARIEAIRLFLAYASFKDFVVYQMNVKSDFLLGKIEEEVNVCNTPKIGSQRNVFSGALLHNTIAQVMKTQ
ncbi:copia protein [Tanacetum coccineum]